MKIELTLNGKMQSVETAPLTRLLDLIHDGLDLKGCKEGCGEGECGACSVIMNGQLVNACMVPAMQASGAEIVTIEGLGDKAHLDLLQKAFIDEGAVHCGYCTPGMILAARDLLENIHRPSREEIKVALSGNLCRCTGYERIYAAVHKAAAEGYHPRKTGPGSFAKPEFSGAEAGNFYSPRNLAEALQILAKQPDLLILSGNTDIGPEMKGGKVFTNALDIFGIPELKKIELVGNDIHIGSAVTQTQIVESELIRKHLPALRAAAESCGAPAIRNRATVGGNFCTASGAADLPGALFALNAKAQVVSLRGVRTMPASEFITGYRKPNLQAGELLEKLIVPVPPAHAHQKFFKRGSRAALTLSRVSLALYVELGKDGVIGAARAAAGSMSPTPIRLPKLEAALQGKKLDAALIDNAVETLRNELTPRKSALYRKALSGNLLRRFLEGVLG